jgi:hypothetical protein
MTSNGVVGATDRRPFPGIRLFRLVLGIFRDCRLSGAEHGVAPGRRPVDRRTRDVPLVILYTSVLVDSVVIGFPALLQFSRCPGSEK